MFLSLWRYGEVNYYAVAILKIISEIFQDVDVDFSAIDEQDLDLDESGFSEWNNIRDDSTLLPNFFDTQDLEGIGSSMDTYNSCTGNE